MSLHQQITQEKRFPARAEVVLIPMTGKPSLYPGLFIFTNPCRMVRPVRNLSYGRNEWIGTLEQVGFAYSRVTEVPDIKN